MKKFLLLLLSLSCVACVRAPLRSVDPGASLAARKYVGIGVGALQEGDLKLAEAQFALALEVADIPEALDGLGCVAFQRHEYLKAKQLFEATIERFPQYSDAYANLARLLELHGDRESALRLYQQALVVKPENHRARNNYAAYLHDNNEAPGKVRAELLKAHTVVPERLIEDNLRRTE